MRDPRGEEMETLDNDLTLFSQALAYPATPDLAQRVRMSISDSPPARPSARPWLLAVAGIAVAVVLTAALAGSIAPAREVVASFFDRINVFQTDEPTTGLPTEITGTEVTLTQAESLLGDPVLLPSYRDGLPPKRILFQEYGRFNTVVTFFEPAGDAPFLVVQTNAFVGKGLPVDSGATAAAVEDLPGDAYWIEGAHTVEFHDDAGQLIPESKRLTGENTLIFDSDGLVFRIEGDLSQDEALRIAKSLR